MLYSAYFVVSPTRFITHLSLSLGFSVSLCLSFIIHSAVNCPASQMDGCRYDITSHMRRSINIQWLWRCSSTPSPNAIANTCECRLCAQRRLTPLSFANILGVQWIRDRSHSVTGRCSNGTNNVLALAPNKELSSFAWASLKFNPPT